MTNSDLELSFHGESGGNIHCGMTLTLRVGSKTLKFRTSPKRAGSGETSSHRAQGNKPHFRKTHLADESEGVLGLRLGPRSFEDSSFSCG
jgi:hypothetical protein